MNFKTIERIENRIRVIAQTKLPNELTFLDIDNYPELIGAIRRLDVRGAPAIGIAAAYGLALAVNFTQNCNLAFIEKVSNEIKNARPTAVNLAWAVDRVLSRLNVENPDGLDQTLSALWDEAEKIHEEDRILCDNIGINGAKLFSDGDSVLTHCNAGALATGGIGTALGVIYTCRDQGKNLRVYADETRPLLQGARLTTWELMQENIDVTLICDNTAAMLMRQGKIDHVIVGADRVAKNGDFANKIGTYSVAVNAEKHGVPFYIAAPYSTFDPVLETGDDIPIEERDPIEVTEGLGKRTAPEKVKIYSPAFDITPFELVSYYITDKEVKPGGRAK